MKSTTIMVEEDILYELKQITQIQGKATSLLIREALATYIIEQHQIVPPENPLLSIIVLGASEEPMDLSNGGDEVLLREGIHPFYGWSVVDDSSLDCSVEKEPLTTVDTDLTNLYGFF